MKKILAIVLSALICLLPVCHVAAEEGIATVKPGDIVTFGRYPQTKSGKDDTPIDWIVLDVKDGKALLCSKYGLDTVPYYTGEIKEKPWQDCYLRSWLNDDFLYAAFDQDERSAIQSTLVDNSTAQGHYPYVKHGGNNTIDQIFVLSAAEANEYFGAEWKREHNANSRIQPTEYALSKGAYVNKDYTTNEFEAAARWWLRTPGREYSEACVNYDGSLGNRFYKETDLCVRPVFWVDLKSEVFQNENPIFAPEPFAFRNGVLWGMNKEEVMAQEGLDQVEYHSEAMDGMMYIGRNVSVYPCRLYYLFSSDSLAAAFYTIDEPDRDKLDYLKRVYSAKYGDEKEADTDECFRIMKKFDDGADESEFRNGKIYAWETPEGTQIWIISLLPQRDQIYITYVSPYFLKQAETEVMDMDGV